MMHRALRETVSEVNALTMEVVLPRICACLATLNIFFCVWPGEPNWSHAAIMAFIATMLWSTVISERARFRARNESKRIDADPSTGELSSKYRLRFYAIFASIYTVLTVIWAHVVGLWWIALAILPALYWHHAYQIWKKSRSVIETNS